MPIINNIPDEMITEHINWHTRPGNPQGGGRKINPWPPGRITAAPGSGEEFLVWHKGYIDRFRSWIDSLPTDQKPKVEQLSPWTEISPGLKMGMVGWGETQAVHEARLRDMNSFGTLDELGRFLEWGLHGWLHNACASMFDEPVLLGFRSPRVTYFWQIHGLIDHWRQKWEDAQ